MTQFIPCDDVPLEVSGHTALKGQVFLTTKLIFLTSKVVFSSYLKILPGEASNLKFGT